MHRISRASSRGSGSEAKLNLKWRARRAVARVSLVLAFALAFLATLLPIVTALAHAAGAALAAGILALQLSHHLTTPYDGAPPTPTPPSASTAAIALPMAVALVLPLASACLRLPRAYHETILAALAG